MRLWCVVAGMVAGVVAEVIAGVVAEVVAGIVAVYLRLVAIHQTAAYVLFSCC
jgi:hypothetical protein